MDSKVLPTLAVWESRHVRNRIPRPCPILCSMPGAHSSASIFRGKDLVGGSPDSRRTRTRQVVPFLPTRFSMVAKSQYPQLSQLEQTLGRL